METYHECPIRIFGQVQEVTGGDYALVHLFEESEAYYHLFERALRQGRTVILDNSIFELGMAFDTDSYIDWILKLKPTYYIIPDVLEDKDATLANLEKWDMSIPGRTISVVQGKTFNEVKECYLEMVDKVDKVAFSFDYCFFDSDESHNKYYNYMVGRVDMLRRLVEEGVIDTSKPHHLLGCGLPQEFSFYKDYDWVESVDTSNPVVAGLKGWEYGPNGLDDKPSQKLFTMINEDVSEEKLELVLRNINSFKKICG